MANFRLGGGQGQGLLPQHQHQDHPRPPSSLGPLFPSSGSSNADLEEDLMVPTTLTVQQQQQMDYQQYLSLPATPLAARRNFSQGTSGARRSSAFDQQQQQRRHYKKDSRFVLDLYTLTFDDGETLETCKTVTCYANNNNNNNDDEREVSSVAHHTPNQQQQPQSLFTIPVPHPSSAPSLAAIGPMSLGAAAGVVSVVHRDSKQVCLPSLETNLHKILARKIQDSEEVSFRKAKLLTKAYYKLLRETSTPLVDPLVQVQRHRNSLSVNGRNSVVVGGGPRLSWQVLLRTDPAELRRTARGLGNTAKALNEYLVELLVERDALLGRQDEMLDEISEITDRML